jgi:type II secretory pathway pseudopilin PulG
MQKNSTLNRGFTLLQLLFAIVIMGLFISVVITSLNPVRAKSRDSKRLSDLNQMKVALEFYREAVGHYPYSCSGTFPNNLSSFDSPTYQNNQVCDVLNGNPTPVGSGGNGLGTLTSVMAPYIPKIADPKLTLNDSGYIYMNISGASNYCFMIFRTPEDLRNFPLSSLNPTRCGGINNGTGQCNVAGTNTGIVNSVFIGKGTYATTGC